jgi:GDPmannose 4,6-dehydratase
MKNPTAIIFGVNGQDGYYLTLQCQNRGIRVIGISRSGDFMHGDVGEFNLVEQLVKEHEPTYIFHLAANSTTRHDALFENNFTISTGTLNILEASRKHCPYAKIFITGSGLQFQNDGKPISETTPFEAINPYAIARIQSVYAARYFRSLGMEVYVGYLFHHESPLRKPNHISQMIALAANRIAKGSNETIELGDISVEKEWTFAGDIAQGIFTLVDQDISFEAAIGSGFAYSIENWLEQCFKLIGKDWRSHVRYLDGFIPEYKRLVSDPRTINSLGWFSTVDLSELATMMMRDSL